MKALENSKGRADYQAINSLARMESKKAVQPLLRIAAERREKDNRDRWMAVRALGLIGDRSVVPELIHLVYHYNQNTRFWAQISLVRLTGQNFEYDWQAWGRWWNEQGGKPRFSPEQVSWTVNPKFMEDADPKRQVEMDRQFIMTLPGRPDNGARPKPTVATDDGTLVIPSQVAWTDTGIDVKKGQIIDISAKGRISGCHGPESAWAYGPFSPEGMIRQGEGADEEWVGRRLLYLRARVGSKEIRVGQQGSFKATESGRLHLGVYDPYYADNLGSFLVKVQLLQLNGDPWVPAKPTKQD